MPKPVPADSQRFEERSAVSGTDVFLAAEAEALGSDYQANGYTTLAQADMLGDLLGLEPGQTLLDLGSGCGWPGMYLAKKHGCGAICIDTIEGGSRTARQRALTDGIADRAWAVRGNAEAIPLAPGSVDAVVHCDLLC